MNIPALDVPDFNADSLRAQTGQTRAHWFAALEAQGGVAKGRRELAHHLMTAHGLSEWWAITLVVEFERQAGALEKDGQPKGYSICSTKTIHAPLARVFQAFGEARDLERWLGAEARVEFADGGTLANGEGDRATFTRIRAQKDLRLAWEHPARAPGSQVEVLFADKGKGKTGLTLNHTRIQDRRSADELRAGWSAAFERLKTLLEST